jgi:hypothetical protein
LHPFHRERERRKRRGRERKGKRGGGTKGEKEGAAGGWPSSSGAVVRTTLDSGDPSRGGVGSKVLARGEVRGGVVAECGNSFGGVASEQLKGPKRLEGGRIA